MNETINSSFCSIDFTLGSLILIVKENNSDFVLVKDKFSNSENFITTFLDFFKHNNLKLENLNFFMVNLGPGGFVGLRNILASIKSISLINKTKVFGFNNFQILKTTIINLTYKKIALEVNNRFYIKDLKNCDEFYSKFTVQNSLEVNSSNIVKYSKLPKYTSKNLQYILDNKLFIESKIFPIYENI
jgi:tRNA A37 threonylcarbamoyladenosine modification protein TsaB